MKQSTRKEGRGKAKPKQKHDKKKINLSKPKRFTPPKENQHLLHRLGSPSKLKRQIRVELVRQKKAIDKTKKTLVQEELQKAIPDFEKIKELLKGIESRGWKQRVNKKIKKMQVIE